MQRIVAITNNQKREGKGRVEGYGGQHKGGVRGDKKENRKGEEKIETRNVEIAKTEKAIKEIKKEERRKKYIKHEETQRCKQ